MTLLCACYCCLKNHLGAGLVEGRYIGDLCHGRQAGDCGQHSDANSKFGHSELTQAALASCRCGSMTNLLATPASKFL